LKLKISDWKALQLASRIGTIGVMFAVVNISGKQYKVQKGDRIQVAKMPGTPGDTLKLDQVYLVSDEKNVKIGTPTVTGSIVTAKIVDFIKGEKINVRRYKSKVRYRKSIGFRPQYTDLEIISIV
jgi:large subunit ribosomal protein L21